jgi:hypothetical protein
LFFSSVSRTQVAEMAADHEHGGEPEKAAVLREAAYRRL